MRCSIHCNVRVRTSMQAASSWYHHGSPLNLQRASESCRAQGEGLEVDQPEGLAAYPHAKAVMARIRMYPAKPACCETLYTADLLEDDSIQTGEHSYLREPLSCWSTSWWALIRCPAMCFVTERASCQWPGGFHLRERCRLPHAL